MHVTKEQFAKRFNARFRKQNGQDIPEAWLSWMFAAFKSGYSAGEENFMRTHDWYE